MLHYGLGFICYRFYVYISDPLCLWCNYFKCSFPLMVCLLLFIWHNILLEFLIGWNIKCDMYNKFPAIFYFIGTQHLKWKLCKSFKSCSAQVLDVQFGVTLSGLKMVSPNSKFKHGLDIIKIITFFLSMSD